MTARKGRIVMAVNTQLMTAEELIKLPRGVWRYELVNGELRRMTPGGYVHGEIAAEVLGYLTPFVREHQLGRTYVAETGFLLRRGPDTVRAPDAAFVTSAKLQNSPLSGHGFFPGAPDLALEVISPSDTYSEVKEKVAEWLAAGTQVVIVLDPRRKTASVYRAGNDLLTLGPADTLCVPELLPGWSVALSDIFR